MNTTRDRHRTGLPEMDAQHDRLFSLFDRIVPAWKGGAGEDAAALFGEIEGYLLFHFSSEEHLMRHYKFPGFAVHSSDHEAAGARLAGFLDDVEAGRLNPESMSTFLTGWLSEHSRSSDSACAEWIIEFRKKTGLT